MTREGGCHCGAIRYAIEKDPIVTALCHCADCRRSAGAPMVGWTMMPEASFRLLKGEPKTYVSSQQGRRGFCADCGTGLTYRNDQMLPGLVDVQAATLDDPEAFPPQIHVQAIEQLGWMADAHALPRFERYPPQD